MPEKVIIIGAGIAGLSVGCYLQMNGFDTEIFEMHGLPGGVCTGWSRGGYTFDACIHWLMGSGPASNLNRMWRELHAVQGRRFVEWESYLRFRARSGELFTIYTDPENLEREMLRLGPQDARLIRSLCDAIRKISRFDMMITPETMSRAQKLRGALSYVGVGPTMARWSAMSRRQLIDGFQSPVLREALDALYGGSMTDFPVVGMLMMLGFMHKRSAGYPIGGSLELARAIEARYRELGGRVRYGTRVDRILVRGDRATGVAVGNDEHPADEVISCADGHATLFDMLGGRYLSPELRTAYETSPVFPSLVLVGVGIARDLRDQPAMQSFPLREELRLENGALVAQRMGVRIFNFDPTTAPAGKTAAVVMIESRGLPFWKALRESDPDAYRAEKKRVGDLVVAALDEEIGDIARHVEVVDVATPATWQRYTGNWQGAYEGFLPTRKNMMKSLGSTLPGLSHFWMHGQWVNPGGGLPPCGMGARSLAKALCRSYGKSFTASE